MTLSFRYVKEEDLMIIAKIEEESYPPDEKATLEKFQFRWKNAPTLFICAEMDGEIIGYITSTRCNVYDEDTMKFKHEPEGKLMAIHSVCTVEKVRRKGYATLMMQDYLKLTRSKETGIDKAVLITKAKNLNVYLQAGFTCVGKSKLVHGKDVWLDCECDFRSREFFVVDSFATIPGKGNPAAVMICFDVVDQNLGPLKPWMQKVAAEFNLSETAFVFKFDNKETYKILFFTPTDQIILCGHATLASAKILFGKLGLKNVDFELDDGRIIKTEQNSEGKIIMYIPRVELHDSDVLSNSGVIDEVLHIPSSDVVVSKMTAVGSEKVCLLEITPEAFEKLYDVDLDFNLMARRLPHILIVCTRKLKCAKMGKGKFDFTEYETQWGFDFFSRVFGPAIGITEDPVTGMAHSPLFSHFVQCADLSTKPFLRAFQASKRGGILEANITDDKVIIKADAVVVSTGRLQF